MKKCAANGRRRSGYAPLDYPKASAGGAVKGGEAVPLAAA